MRESKFLCISIIMLSLSILVGCIWIGNSIKSVSMDPYVKEQIKEKEYSILLTQEEAGNYLNLHTEVFEEVIKQQDSQRIGLSIYDSYRFIVYMRIDGKKYFNKDFLDRWVEYNMENRENIYLD